MTSFSVVSLIAIVPERECKIPILIVSSARAAKALRATAPPTNAPAARNIKRLVTDIVDPILNSLKHSGAQQRSGSDTLGSQAACHSIRYRSEVQDVIYCVNRSHGAQ